MLAPNPYSVAYVLVDELLCLSKESAEVDGRLHAAILAPLLESLSHHNLSFVVICRHDVDYRTDLSV